MNHMLLRVLQDSPLFGPYVTGVSFVEKVLESQFSQREK